MQQQRSTTQQTTAPALGEYTHACAGIAAMQGWQEIWRVYVSTGRADASGNTN
jgi:hypothetical protein